MGIVSTTLSQSNNMKFLLVLAVVAAARAEAEAKPGFVYTTGLHHAPLVYNHLPVVYNVAPVGCQNNEGAAVPCAHGVLPALPYGLVPAVAAPAAAEAEESDVVSVEKREATAEAEAEADPEADPWLAYYSHAGYGLHPYGYGYYGHHLGYSAYAGYHPYAAYGGCRNGYGALVPCAGK